MLLISNTFWFLDHKKEQKRNETIQSELTKFKGESIRLENEVSQLTGDYDQLYKEKNGQANEKLLSVANELFSYLYDYDTSKKNDSIADRKKKAAKLTTESALNTLFPRDADQGAYTVTSVSKIEGNEGKPEVYLMSSDDKEIQALILVTYSVSIAGSEKIDGSNMFKAKFNPKNQEFIEMKNLGQISIP